MAGAEEVAAKRAATGVRRGDLDVTMLSWWEVSGECLGGVWGVSRRCLGGVWAVSAKCLGSACDVTMMSWWRRVESIS